MARGRRSGSAGFSLAELVIVLVIVVILSGAVTVSVRETDRMSRLATASGKALSDLRYAQEIAMSERRRVNFSVSGNTYSATYRDTGAPLPSPLDPGKSLIVTLNTTADGMYSTNGVVITSSLGGTIYFETDGRPYSNTGANLPSETSIMNLNGKQNIVLYNSGYSVINPVAGVCGGCGC